MAKTNVKLGYLVNQQIKQLKKERNELLELLKKRWTKK